MPIISQQHGRLMVYICLFIEVIMRSTGTEKVPLRLCPLVFLNHLGEDDDSYKNTQDQLFKCNYLSTIGCIFYIKMFRCLNEQRDIGNKYFSAYIKYLFSRLSLS